MQHDQRICPRCGKSAGDYHFCPSCLAPVESSNPSHAGTNPGDASPAAPQPAREVLLLEQTSNHDGNRIAGDTPPAVQLDLGGRRPEARTAHASAASANPAEVSLRANRLLSPVPQPPRDVARLEDVLTVAPKSAPERAASAVPEVQKKADETPAEAKADAVLHSADEADSDWVRLRREVARLEQVMTRASAAEDEQVAPKAPAAMTPDRQAEVPTTTEAQAGAPNHVAAHVLREAF